MKKLYLILLLCLTFSINAYSSDFVFGFVGNLGASSAYTDKISASDFRTFDGAFSIQPGIIFGYDNFISSALLFDIGYNNDNHQFVENINGERVVDNYSFNSLSFGLFPRLNIGILSFGIGGGIKVPLSVKYSNGSSYQKHLDFGDLRDTFNELYYPYIKASIDFLIKTKKNSMFTIGAYATYDFPITVKENNILTFVSIDRNAINSFEAGVQIGLYFVND